MGTPDFKNPAVDTIAALAAARADKLASRAFALGLAVDAEGPGRRAIPISATPVVLSTAKIAARRRDASHIAAAAAKLSRSQNPLLDSALDFGEFTPVERRLLQARGERTLHLATLRVDGFDAPNWRGIEINSTIPAMQGYSDIAAQAWIETLGAALDWRASRIAATIERNGSNARALFQALLSFNDRQGAAAPERIGLLCRRGDAQISELRFLVRRFEDYGIEAGLLHPDELAIEQHVVARGRCWPLIYRHYFAYRLDADPNPALEHLFAQPQAHGCVLANPPAPDLEAKRLFAELSGLVEDDARIAHAGLSSIERDAIRRRLPWSRRLAAGPALLADGARTDNLVEHVAALPTEFVLKRSQGYGGQGVWIGADCESAGFAERAQAVFDEPLSWAQLIRRAANSNNAYIVQARLEPPRQRMRLCAPDSAHDAELYIDYSAFASLPDAELPWTGVCRASTQRVVNIVGGGGVVPLLTEEVARELCA